MTEKIQYKPHRGIDRVTEVRKAEVTLFENHLELTYNYRYENQLGQEDVMICAAIVHKKDIALFLTQWVHQDDKEKTLYPRVEILINGSYNEYIYVEEMKEAAKIYNHIKTWMLK